MTTLLHSSLQIIAPTQGFRTAYKKMVIVVEESGTSHWIDLIHGFLDKFGWLADSFVVDFYEESHWNRLPISWQEFLPKITPEELGDLLDFNVSGCGISLRTRGEILPLSLLAFKSTAKLLSLNRQKDVDFLNGVPDVKQNNLSNTQNPFSVVDEFKNLFNRHVKPKKRQEIVDFCKIVSRISDKSSTQHVFDVGAGLGHLSRYLTYGCSLNLTCIDCIGKFGESATKFDAELEIVLAKRNYTSRTQPPIHLCLQLELNKHEQELQREENFGIIGLHSCGNLAPVIIHNFVNSPSKFMVSVGCCWKKMDDNGFPLSKYAKRKGLKLRYEALEVACHAVEQYCQRLRDGHVAKLMIHAYRAALETVLIKKFGIRRAGLRGVRGCQNMAFAEYAVKAVRDLDITLTEDLLHNDKTEKMIKDWYKVVLFYSLRLIMANVIETLVIIDRGLFIKENICDSTVNIVALFDPIISPRNLAIIGERS